jgi:hypothetical protein
MADSIIFSNGSDYDVDEYRKSKDNDNHIGKRVKDFIREEPTSEVNHPSHYNHGGMETIDKMIKLYGIEKVKAFCELNAFKYRDRAGYKGSSDSAIARDVHKALWYENKLNELNNK